MSEFHGPLFLQHLFFPPVLLTCVYLALPLPRAHFWSVFGICSTSPQTSAGPAVINTYIEIKFASLQSFSVGGRVCEIRGYEEKAQKLNLVLGTDPSNMIDLRPLLFLTVTQVVVLHTIQSACNFLSDISLLLGWGGGDVIVRCI